MSSNDASRKQAEPLPGRDRAREQTSQSNAQINTASPVDMPPPRPGGSLRSRITDKETIPAPVLQAYRAEIPRKDDERDNRKRTASGISLI
jgi:THO complex subunit 2